MAKKALNLFKKIGRAYMRGAVEYYRPFVTCGVSPCI